MDEKPDLPENIKSHLGPTPVTLTDARKTVQGAGTRDPVVFQERHATTKITSLRTGKKVFSADEVRLFLRQMDILEKVVIHEMDREQFMKEQDLKWLGKGGEGTVYFLRGHVVKLVEPNHVEGTLREIAHLLYLNPLKSRSEGILGGRTRVDFPSLIWVYVLTDGSLAVGMNCFDADPTNPGCTLDQRLRYGPPMFGDYVVNLLLQVCKSLAYCHYMGLIHHDLKPSNIYLPGDPRMPPVIFDLGQALWKRSAWGRDWLKHEHNSTYWYNGTFRYMHGERRRAHRAVMRYVANSKFTTIESEWHRAYAPAYYDDLYAMSRIFRDFENSSFPCLGESEKRTFRALRRRIMGNAIEKQPAKPESKPSASARWLSNVFARKESQATLETVESARMSMEKLVQELEGMSKAYDVASMA